MRPFGYPEIIDEAATLTLVHRGFGLARFGDGEFNLCHGRPAKLQAPDAVLRGRLLKILKWSYAGACLVGVPNIFTPTPKADFWTPFARMGELMADEAYVSAFVTRPDSAPWIDTPDYWQAIEALWVGQDVTLVRGTAKSLTAADLVGARSVREVLAPVRDAWRHYDRILEEVGTSGRAILCLGPTATVLAVDLCARGVHAIDLGHIGLFLKKHRRGLPMTLTPEDRAA